MGTDQTNIHLVTYMAMEDVNYLNAGRRLTKLHAR